MYDQVFNAVRDMAIGVVPSPYTTIEIGSLPSGETLAMYQGPSLPREVYMNRGELSELLIALNGKHRAQAKVTAALSALHSSLKLAESYPSGEGWQILSIETATAPSLLEREPSEPRCFLYGSLLRVKVYFEGVE